MNYPAASRRGINKELFIISPQGAGNRVYELGAANMTHEIPRLRFGIAQCERSGSVQKIFLQHFRL